MEHGEQHAMSTGPEVAVSSRLLLISWQESQATSS
jgi:hypothetical protein